LEEEWASKMKEKLHSVDERRKEKFKTSMLSFPFRRIIYWQINVFLLKNVHMKSLFTWLYGMLYGEC
jgi:hypothetical protein